MGAWTAVPLREILELRKPTIDTAPEVLYRFAGVRSFGGGVFASSEKFGSEFSYTRLSKVYENDLVYPKLMAWEGAVGVVPRTCSGRFVSPEFCVFTIDQSRASPAYLNLYFKTSIARRTLKAASSGTNVRRRRIYPDRFLELTVPMPCLEEQEAIASKTTSILEHARELGESRERMKRVCDSLVAAELRRLWQREADWRHYPLGDVASLASGQVDPKVPPYSRLPHINGANIESGTCRLLNNYDTAAADGVVSGKYHFKPGNILYSKIRPYLRKSVQVDFEGVCSADIYVITETAVFLNPKFLMYSLISPPFDEYSARLSGRTRIPKLNQKQLFAYSLGVPAIAEQERIVSRMSALVADVAALAAANDEATRVEGALPPSILNHTFRLGASL